jgi:hypothetical protein
MGILSEDMTRVVQEQRLGFVATVSPDGTPNLSPKGTTAVDEDPSRVAEFLRAYEEQGTTMIAEAGTRARAVVRVRVEYAAPLVSPGYDWVESEEEMRAHWWLHFEELERSRS